MKKSRVTAIVVGVLALTIAVAGAAYAWFVASAGAIGGEGNAAKLKLNKSHEELTLAFESVLPGESVTFADGQTVEYESDRGGILEISIDAINAAKIKLDSSRVNPADAKFLALVGTDYKKVGNDYYMTTKRVKEILEVTLGSLSGAGGNKLPIDIDNAIAEYDDGITNHTLKFGVYEGRIYTYVKGAQVSGSDAWQTVKVDLSPKNSEGKPQPIFAVHFLGEFGGNHKGSQDRYWEQEAIFEDGVGLTIKAVQATADAVTSFLDTEGTGIHTWLKSSFAISEKSWEYVG